LSEGSQQGIAIACAQHAWLILNGTWVVNVRS